MQGSHVQPEPVVCPDPKPRRRTSKNNPKEKETSSTNALLFENRVEPDEPIKRPVGNAPIESSPFPHDWAAPDGFQVSAGRITTKDGVFVAAPAFFVVATTSDDRNRNFGRMLTWRAGKGEWEEWVMPMAALLGGMKELRTELLGAGLSIGYSKEENEALRNYILSSVPIRHVTSTTRTGWRDDNFVLPGRVIGPDADTLRFAGVESHFGLATRGDIESWKQTVAAMSAGNTRLAFAISCAFGSPLLNVVQTESGGFHYRGRTSVGKTTALLAGASVIGGPDSLRSWRTTANGLETIAEAHCDLPLMLDEIGQCEPKQVGEIAYLLANGQGKTRMDSDANAQKRYRWRVLFLSSGEETLVRCLERANIVVRGGQEVRLLDIEADAGRGTGIVEDIKGFPNSAEFISAFQRAAKSNYGAVGLAFLEHLTANVDAARLFVQGGIEHFIAANVPEASPGEVSRAAGRFGLVAAAGELATSYGLTDWQPGEATSAAATLFRAWLTSRGERGFDTERRLAMVRDFITENQSRFTTGKPKVLPDGSAGLTVTDRGRQAYLIAASVWRNEVCQAEHPVEVIRAVQEAGFLISDSGRVDKRHRVGDKNLYFYAINAAILETSTPRSVTVAPAENSGNDANRAA